MKGLIVFSLIFALAAPAAADKVDLTQVFDEDFRDQCDTGSCHAFASVAVLEAAMRRRRRDSEPVYLSDADLFLRTSVINGRIMEVYRDDPTQIERILIEGGWPSRDLAIALEHGVARAKSVPWDKFLVKFRDYRKHRVAIAHLTSADERAAKDLEFFYDNGEDMAERSEALHLERLEVRRLLAGFTVHSSTYLVTGGSPEERARCRVAGRAAKSRLMEDLAVRRPVVVCLAIGGLPEWGSPASPTGHCVAIVGYRKERGADMALLVRNSWGDDRHPDIPEDRFCRITEVTSIRP